MPACTLSLNDVADRSRLPAPGVLVVARCLTVASGSAGSGSVQEQPQAAQAWNAAVAQITSEEDSLWTPDTREGHAEIRARGAAFLRWLLVRGHMCYRFRFRFRCLVALQHARRHSTHPTTPYVVPSTSTVHINTKARFYPSKGRRGDALRLYLTVFCWRTCESCVRAC